MSDEKRIETPEQMAVRLWPDRVRPSLARLDALDAIRARDEQIAAWCEAQAKEADTEPMQGCFYANTPAGRAARGICISAAGAFRAVAAMLKKIDPAGSHRS